MRVTGAVLTGGASRRMGRDKALLEVEGATLAERVVACLVTAGVDDVVCVGGDRDALQARGLAVLADRLPGQGPLGGVLTALDHPDAGDAVVILAVDLADPDPHLVRELVAALHDDADLVVPLVDDRRQWLHGVWRRATATPVVAAALAAGERAVHRGASGLRVRDLVDVSPTAVADLDRPEDLTQLRRQK